MADEFDTSNSGGIAATTWSYDNPYIDPGTAPDDLGVFFDEWGLALGDYVGAPGTPAFGEASDWEGTVFDPNSSEGLFYEFKDTAPTSITADAEYGRYAEMLGVLPEDIAGLPLSDLSAALDTPSAPAATPVLDANAEYQKAWGKPAPAGTFRGYDPVGTSTMGGYALPMSQSANWQPSQFNAAQQARNDAAAARKAAGRGQVAAGQAAGAAAGDATQYQLQALDKIKGYLEKNLDPEKLAGISAAQDRARVKASLDLQKEVDPGMAKVRQAAQDRVLASLTGMENSPANQLAKQAATLASTEAANPATLALQEKFLTRANEELDLGTTLPSDLQAELVQAGLQRAGAVTGSAGAGSGVGRNIATQLFGQAALQLRAQRQAAAQTLSNSAQQLQQSRLQLLSGLFPALKQNQLADLNAAGGAFQASDAAVPKVGMGGNELVNTYLAKIGAMTQNIQDVGRVAGQGTLASGQAAGQILGGAAASGGSASVALPDYTSWLSKVGLS